MKKNNKKVLVIGIGNAGRQDDALGWIFLDYLEAEHFEHIEMQYRYKLQVEDAELISSYDRVLFIDACKNQTGEGFFFKPCIPKERHSFTTQSLNPEAVLYLAGKLYAEPPEAFVLSIQGYEWELDMGVTDKAYKNYLKALEYFTSHYEDFINTEKQFTYKVLNQL